jgi:cob(I)alamin adenosyltransferase
MKKIEFDRVTTRGGDGGETSLYNGERRRKDDPLFEALGDLDELSSFLGVVKVDLRFMGGVEGHTGVQRIEAIQKVLLRAGAQIATPSADPRYKGLDHVTSRDVFNLEKEEKALLGVTMIEPSFILPGGNAFSAGTDIARAVCRRAERRVVALIRERGSVELADVQRYLNRLSDFLFVLARKAEQAGTVQSETEHGETKKQGGKTRPKGRKP